jgi:Xaa-Pro aminopeptidase
MKVKEIPMEEYQGRIAKAQEKVREKGLDMLIAHSHEADFGNVRYFSDYWPIFESAGVLIPAEGEPILLIGPESETFARDRSKINRIKKLVEYRESAEPDYPTIKVDTFDSIFSELYGEKKPSKIGLAGYQIFPLPVYNAIRKAAPKAEIIKSDEIIFDLRVIKSPVELEMLAEAFRIAEKALSETLNRIGPDMTELQIVGVIEELLYREGAEYEGHPQYVLSGKNSTHAIGRPSYKVVGRNNLIQMNVGARVNGYSSSVGRPISFGKMDPDTKKLVEAGLELHLKTMEWMKAGVIAKEVVKKFFSLAEKLDVSKNILYGPCHGLGMMEVERPWMEITSDYPLEEGMTFQIDTFLYDEKNGLRWEDGVVVERDSVRPFSNILQHVIEL